MTNTLKEKYYSFHVLLAMQNLYTHVDILFLLTWQNQQQNFSSEWRSYVPTEALIDSLWKYYHA